MASLGKISASEGDKLTLIDARGEWKLVPATELKPFPPYAYGKFINQLRQLLVILRNLIIGEVSYEVVVPTGTRLKVDVSSQEIAQKLQWNPQVEVLYDPRGFIYGEQIVEFKLCGDLTGITVSAIPI